MTEEYISKPLVTVAMPLFNGEEFLRGAIDSILTQTYGNIDLLIIDDGSTDESTQIVASYSDPRIRFFQNEKNMGVAYTRNKAIELSNGEYLAWMDCDDLCSPNKIELQVRFMENNKEIAVCGTSYLQFFEDEIFYETIAKSGHEEIRANFIFKPPTIFMPTSIIRSSIFEDETMRFDNDLEMAEDYDFFQRVCEKYKASNLEDVLFQYRDNPTSLTHTFENRTEDRYLLKQKIYARILGGISINAEPSDLRNHDNCINNTMFDDYITVKNCMAHLRKIERFNNRSLNYDQKILRDVIKNQLFFVAKKGGGLGLKNLYHYTRTIISFGYYNGMSQYAKVALRSILRYKKFNLKNKVFKIKDEQLASNKKS